MSRGASSSTDPRGSGRLAQQNYGAPLTMPRSDGRDGGRRGCMDEVDSLSSGAARGAPGDCALPLR